MPQRENGLLCFPQPRFWKPPMRKSPFPIGTYFWPRKEKVQTRNSRPAKTVAALFQPPTDNRTHTFQLSRAADLDAGHYYGSWTNEINVITSKMCKIWWRYKRRTSWRSFTRVDISTKTFFSSLGLLTCFWKERKVTYLLKTCVFQLIVTLYTTNHKSNKSETCVCPIF